jgi:isopentenyldiphosphate isomerase
MSKDVQPGKWDTSVGGHVSPGEEIIDAVKREASEELGLEDPEVVFEGRYIWQSQIERELVNVFTTSSDLIPLINREEIEEGKFWTIDEIMGNIGKGVFTPNFEHEFRMHAGGNESFAGKFSRRAFRKK